MPARRAGEVVRSILGTILVIAWSGTGTASAAPFIANHGQTSAAVLYYAEAPGLRVALERDAILVEKILVAGEGTKPDPFAVDEGSVAGAWSSVVFRIAFDLSPTARIEAAPAGQARHHFYRGSDPDAWVTGVPDHEEVRFLDPVHGRGLAVRLDEGGLSMSPTAMGGAIPWELEVAAGVELVHRDSETEIRTELGTLRLATGLHGTTLTRIDERPSSAREVDLEWGTFLGGALEDFTRGGAIDPGIGVWSAGWTSSLDFPTTPGAYSGSLTGAHDFHISRLSPDGQELLSSTYLGGSDDDFSYQITSLPGGALAVTGYTLSDDFPISRPTIDPSWNGDRDLVVVKVDSSGLLVGSTYLGGPARDEGVGITSTADGTIYLTGLAYSSSFPVTEGAYDLSHGGDADVVLARVSPDLSELVWSTFLGSTDVEYGLGVDVDADGHPVATGFTLSPGFPTTAGAYDRSFGGDWDVWVASLDAATGSTLRFSTFLGGSLVDRATQVVLAEGGDIIVTGQTESVDFPVTDSAFDRTYNGGSYPRGDAFVARLGPSAEEVIAATYLGGVDDERGDHIGFMPDGGIVIGGSTTSPDFPTTPDAFDRTHAGERDVYLVRFDANLATEIYGSYYGGAEEDHCTQVSILDATSVVLYGGTSSGNSFPSLDGYDSSYNGGGDGFLMRVGLPAVVGVPGDGGHGGPAALRAANPSVAEASFHVIPLVLGDRHRLTVHDVGGRRVATIDAGGVTGPLTLTWNGRDERGRPVEAGVYFVRWRADSGATSVFRMTLLR